MALRLQLYRYLELDRPFNPPPQASSEPTSLSLEPGVGWPWRPETQTLHVVCIIPGRGAAFVLRDPQVTPGPLIEEHKLPEHEHSRLCGKILEINVPGWRLEQAMKAPLLSYL